MRREDIRPIEGVGLRAPECVSYSGGKSNGRSACSYSRAV